ncbi:MAG: bleomycin resistance family protein [Tepidisphaera sp.]|nr:bleomycin resistance family protein [Tepidisphaera sp.]
MIIKAVSPVLNVSDVPASITWFEKLGWHRGFTWNHHGMIAHSALSNDHGPATFAGICANPPSPDPHAHGPSIFLCKDGQGAKDPRPAVGPDFEQYGGVWMSWWVEDTDHAHADCVKHNIEIVKPIVNETWGVREFLIRHPDGHYFRISGPVK